MLTHTDMMCVYVAANRAARSKEMFHLMTMSTTVHILALKWTYVLYLFVDLFSIIQCNPVHFKFLICHGHEMYSNVLLVAL